MPTLSDHRLHIETLIAENHIEEARDYCRRLSNPNARLWLSEINRRFPIEDFYATNNASVDAVVEPFRLYDGEVPPDWIPQREIETNAWTEDEVIKPKLKNDDNDTEYLKAILPIFIVVSVVLNIYLWRIETNGPSLLRAILFFGQWIFVILYSFFKYDRQRPTSLHDHVTYSIPEDQEV